MVELLSDIRPPAVVRDKRTHAARISDWLLGRPAPKQPPERVPFKDPMPGRVGIACSGGGIRSAARTTISQHELTAAAQAELARIAAREGELDAADRRLFRSLVDEIAAAEACAQRPSLALVVQERRPRQSELKVQLTQVWDYWAPAVAPDENGAARDGALLTVARGLLRGR